MKVHPVADLFPMLEGDELAALADDIRENGLRHPIVTLDGVLLDGRNRLAACKLAGVEPRFVEYAGESPALFIVSENVHRRHLSASQKALLAVELLPYLSAEAKDRQRTLNRPDSRLAQEYAKQERNVGKSAAQAGSLLGASSSYVEQAKKVLAEAPDLAADIRAGKSTVSEASATIRKREAKANREATAAASPKLASFVWCGPVIEAHNRLKPGTVDAIITDPPYPKEYLQTFSDLSLAASKLLRPGGYCVVMSGQLHLPEVISRLTEHLNYYWTAAYITRAGGQKANIRTRNVQVTWKPLIVLTNGTPTTEAKWFTDTVESDKNDKEHHDWGQSVNGMKQIVEQFTHERELIYDPFLGGGTTGLAAFSLNRRFVGSDIDDEQCRIATTRLKDYA